MVYLILNWVLSTIALLAVSNVFPGFRVLEFGSALIAAAGVGLMSALLGLVLKHVSGFLTLSMSAAFLTIVDAFLFRVAGLLVPGFAMLGFAPAFAGAVVLLALNLMLLKLAPIREDGDPLDAGLTAPRS